MTDAMLKQLGEDTAIGRSVTQALATAGNLRQILTCPHWSALGRPLEGKPAYIVGAGPSLDKNAEDLWGTTGAVFGVNTSAPAMLTHGVRLDVLVSVEPVNLTSHLARCAEQASLVALDLICSPEAWELTKGQKRVWFTGSSPDALEVCGDLDVPPICHGGAAVTAAFMLAFEWGADPIVLVGHDLAYSEAAPYAAGSGWDGLSMEREGDQLVFTGREDRDALHEQAGVPKVPRDRPTIQVPSWDGEGTVPTVLDYYSQIKWYERHATLPRRLVNATEGGARIEGWEHLPLHSVVRMERDDTTRRLTTDAPQVSPQAVADLLTTVLYRAELTADLAAKLREQQSPEGHPALVEAASHFVEFATQGELIGMERARLPLATRLDGLYAAYQAAAERIREAVRGECQGVEES